jgi:hypothetical protein
MEGEILSKRRRTLNKGLEGVREYQKMGSERFYLRQLGILDFLLFMSYQECFS